MSFFRNQLMQSIRVHLSISHLFGDGSMAVNMPFVIQVKYKFTSHDRIRNTRTFPSSLHLISGQKMKIGCRDFFLYL